MKYWLVTAFTALIACFIGNIMPMTVGSMVMHERLRKLGKGSLWLSKFYRMYGKKGIAKLVIIELLLDVVPVVIGGLLFNSVEAPPEVGRTMAAFCVIFCRMFPLLGRFKGSTDGLFSLMICMVLVNPAVGIAADLVIAGIFYWLRFRTLSVLAGAVAGALFAVAMVESAVAVRLCAMLAIAVVIRNIPNIRKLLSGEEEHIEFKQDISYKFDEKF